MKERNKNQVWLVGRDARGNISFEAAHLCVLQDIRDELQTLNHLLGCSRFLGIPLTLDKIERNTRKPKKKAKPKLRKAVAGT